MLERRTKFGDPWARAGVEGWACLPVESLESEVSLGDHESL